jgi:hypothetical protein
LCTECTVAKEFGVVASAEVGERADVAGGAVVRRVQEPERLRRAVGEGLIDDRGVEAMGHPELVVPARFQPYRPRADGNQTRKHRLVRVAGDEDRLIGL